MIQKHCESGEILLKYEGEAQFEESGKGTVIRFCHRPASLFGCDVPDEPVGNEEQAFISRGT